jgi:hypothetical protein
MAISGSTVWEIRANGNVDNGGGFVAGLGTDHTQQNAAWASFTDLAIGGNTKQLSSATTPFAIDDVGNLIKQTAGVGFTAGRFEPVAFSDAFANVIDFSGSDWLSYADGAPFEVANFTFSAWVRFPNTANYSAILGRWAGAPNQAYLIDLSGSQVRCSVSANGTAFTTATASTFGALLSNQWYHIVGRHDGSTIRVSVNGTTNTAALAGGAYTAGNASFTVGADSNAPSYMTGQMCCLAFYNTSISDANVTALFNNGVPLTYANMTAGLKTNLIAFYDGDESSAGASQVDRSDSHGGGYHLTDNSPYVASSTTTKQSWVIVDRAAGTAGSTGGVGNLGGACTFVDSVIDDPQIIEGMIFYVANDATHVLAAHVAASELGTITAPIKVIGYNTVRGDDPVGVNRPLITGGAWYFQTSKYWQVSNLRMTGSGTYVCQDGDSNLIVNCSIQNTGATTSNQCLRLGVSSRAFGCEFFGTNGANTARGVVSQGDSRIWNCYFHDLDEGVFVNTDNITVCNSVFEDVTVGIVSTTSGSECEYVGNIFYNGTNALETDVSENEILFFGNIVHTQTVGFVGVAGMHQLDYNIWYNNGTDVSGSSKGPHAINADPLFNNPGSGDFTLQSGSPALNAWFPATNYGLAADLDFNIGAAQNDPSAGAGGGGGWW